MRGGGGLKEEGKRKGKEWRVEDQEVRIRGKERSTETSRRRDIRMETGIKGRVCRGSFSETT